MIFSFLAEDQEQRKNNEGKGFLFFLLRSEARKRTKTNTETKWPPAAAAAAAAVDFVARVVFVRVNPLQVPRTGKGKRRWTRVGKKKSKRRRKTHDREAERVGRLLLRRLFQSEITATGQQEEAKHLKKNTAKGDARKQSKGKENGGEKETAEGGKTRGGIKKKRIEKKTFLVNIDSA